MSSYKALVEWERKGETFTNNKYSRLHHWHFDGGQKISASSSPQIVPVPYSDAGAVDPEEAFVASISSCHMLWFLSIAATRGMIVNEYKDEAIGTLSQNKEGKHAMTEVVLNPKVTFDPATQPNQKEHEEMHHQAHAKCFIANSVKTNIRVELR